MNDWGDADASGSQPSVWEEGPDTIEVSFMATCLNEESNVLGTVETITTAMERVGCSYEILVFDDESQPHREHIRRSKAKSFHSGPISHRAPAGSNRGYRSNERRS